MVCLNEIDAYFNKKIKKEIKGNTFFKPGTSAKTVYSSIFAQ